MKLINAGGGTYREFVYNCIRNRQCQKEFFVPIRQLSDMMFYFDLPGKPEDVQVKAMNLCCTEEGGEFDPGDFGDDFFIGGDMPCEYDGVISSYVIGQKPDGSWYGVISGIEFSVPEGVNLKYFIVKVIATVEGGENYYYSQMIEIEDCGPLMYVQGCYPNVLAGDAEDCNGVYYGFHQGPEEHIGNLNFRYFHWAYVRLGSVKNVKRTLNFTAFNSKRTYKTESTKNKLFEFEIVPDFYADHLFSLFERGQIRIDGTEYRLLEQQDFSTIDTDSNWWVLDVQLTEYCKQTFGCGVSDCSLPSVVCCDPVIISAIVGIPPCCDPTNVFATVGE